MKSRGGIVVLVLLAAGLAAALAAVWQQHRQSRRALSYWGVDVVELIDRAERVELFAMKDGISREVSREMDPLNFHRLPSIDLSHVPGLVHFRHSLLEDINFQWERETTASARQWDYAVRFIHGEHEATILFDLDGRNVRRNGADSPAVGITERMARGFATFFEEHRVQ